MNRDQTRQGIGFRQWALLIAFTLSGFTGLIYESIWSHYLKLFLGHSAFAQTLVLAIFMGGMAIGAWLIGRRSSRWQNLLLVYAVVEVLIGILGLAFHPIFEALLHWSLDVAIPSIGAPGSILVFKWATGALLILPQSVLLGMTFPLISGGLIRLAPARTGEFLSLLYFTNCLGAAAGVLVSGFYLIKTVGLPGTLLTAGLLNVFLALFVWLLSRGSAAATVPEKSSATREWTRRGSSWLLASAFLTGVACFLYEMSWIRMLSLVLGSSTHSFELMLAAFILGLAVGGYWIRSRIDHLRDPDGFLARTLLLMGVLAALTIPGYHYTFDLLAWAKSAFASTESGFVGYTFLSQFIAIALMAPVTFFAGMTLPLITRLLMDRGTGEKAIGTVYALNTLGAIVGVLAAVHLFMPQIGVRGTVIAGAAIHLALAIAGSLQNRQPFHRTVDAKAVVVGMLVIGLVAVLVKPDPARLVSAVYRTGQTTIAAGSEIAYLRDGKTATISLTRTGGAATIATNGKPDAVIQMSDGPPAADEITMILVGALPLALHPSPSKVANIGIGSGLTSQTLLSSAHVDSLVSIEIEPFMVDAARLGFMPRVKSLFTDPRSRIVIEDAKTFFAASGSRFDVIVSEPSNPWVSGVATLFSAEFYEQAVRYLEPGGLLVQWLQIYETDIAVVISILKALSPHVSDYHLYNVDDSNILVVAKKDGLLPDPDPGIFSEQALRAELTRAGIIGLGDITSRRIGNKQLLDPYIRSAHVPANSDYFPYVDQNAQRFLFLNRNALELPGLTVLPLPFLELSIPEWKTAPLDAVPEFGRGIREEYSDRAGRILASISSGDLGFVPGEVGDTILAVGMPAETCRKNGGWQAWIAAVRKLSRQTSAMLPYTELYPFWSKVVSSPCYEAAGPGELGWPDFLHAVARRDREEIIRLGQALLQNEASPLGTEDLEYTIAAMAASLYGLGDRQSASKIILSWARVLRPDNEFDLALRILAASGLSH